MKGALKRLLLWLLLALPFLATGWIALEVLARTRGRQAVPHGQPCIASDERLHHRYRPHCRSRFEGSNGTVTYEFNGDGLRDVERAENATPGPLLAVLGDSIVKGLFLPAEQGLPAALARATGRATLNAGVRFTSPGTQLRLMELVVLPHYKLSGVVWVLNEGDAHDERLLRQEATEIGADGVPARFPLKTLDPYLDDWLVNLGQRLPVKSEGLHYLLRAWKFQRFSKLIESVPPSEEILCGGIRALAGALKARKLPLLVVVSPHYPEGIRANWMGAAFDPAHTTTMAECARAAGARVLDLRQEPLRREWYFEDHMHYTATGSDWIAAKIAAALGTR